MASLVTGLLVLVVASKWRNAFGQVVRQCELVLVRFVRLDFLRMGQLVQMVVGCVLHNRFRCERLEIGQCGAHIQAHFVADQRIQTYSCNDYALAVN